MNKNYWCGIRGVYQIWHGQWADPEVRYKNYICNEWDLQESMYITMKDRIADGEDWGDPDNDRDFMNFCKQNADLVKQDIMELSTGGVYESKNIMLRKDKALLESLTRKYGKKNILNEINENKQDEIVSLYKREIFNYLDSLKWDNLYDIIYEFGYGDEYHELVEDIMDALGLDEMEEHYDYLYPYMERIIKEYLIKNKMWR